MSTNTAKTESGKLVKASANHLHVSPRKMRLVTNLIKGMSVASALAQLQHANKKASPMMIKLLQSAVANAKNNFSLQTDHLYVKEVTCDMGKVMKRYFPRARGSAFVIRRKMCHVNLVLEERAHSKAGKAKLGFLKKADTDGEKKIESVDQEIATNQKPVKSTTKKSQVFKTDEQIKMSKVANKRRLFNRKTGV
ncbi:MAG: 50S ribosomal protein L22 [Candidatus Doudnabacteria bacterium]|jgi:large subunit ribosomal protein L22